MTNPFHRLYDLAARYSDIPRPVREGEVIDTSLWSATGNSYVILSVDDAARKAIYRDGPCPAVGDRVQCIRTDSDVSAPWLAFPLPQPSGCGMFYVSAQSLSDSSWHIIRCDTAVGNVWQDMGPHPLGDSGFPRRPLKRVQPDLRFLPGSYNSFALPNRLLTWGSGLDYSGPGDLSYSDDNGATWTAVGIAIVNMANDPDNEGYMYAVSDSTVYYTTDAWTTYGTVSSGPGGTYVDIRANISAGANAAVVMTTAGTYDGFSFHGGMSAWSGPYAPTPGTSAATDGGVEFDGVDFYGGGSVFASLPDTFTTGAGKQFQAFRAGDAYVVATDHPNALPDVLVEGWARFTNAGGDEACYVVGMDDSTVGGDHTRYAVYTFAVGYPWTVADTRQVSDLGAAFIASPDGVSR